MGSIEIPGLLCFLATNRPDDVVRGLNDFPREHWPPHYVHTLFNLMVLIDTSLIFLAALAWVIQWRRKTRPLPRWLLRILVTSGPLSLLGIEIGWVFTCSGRRRR